MNDTPALSAENRALIERVLGRVYEQSFAVGPRAATTLYATELNALLNAARNQAPTPSEQGLNRAQDHALTASGELELRQAVEREIRIWSQSRWPKGHGNGTKGWVGGLTNRILAALATPTPVGGGAVEALKSVADDIFERWDKDMRSGKLLTALAGRLPGYDPRTDAILAALALPPAGIEGSEPVAWLCEGGRERMISMDPKDAAWWRDHGFKVTPLGPLYAHPPQNQGQVSAQDGSALERGTAGGATLQDAPVINQSTENDQCA